jgi:hypothetical protein
MIIRFLSLLLLLATAPSLVSPVPVCCPRDLDCCAHEAGQLPAPSDDCCSIASLNEYLAVSAPLIPQIAPATVPALASVPDLFPANVALAAAATATPHPPRLQRFEVLRN